MRENAAALGAAAGGPLTAIPGARGYLSHQVLLAQTVNGVPVRGRYIAVNIAHDGSILSVENTTAPVRSLDTRPRISPLAAAASAPGTLLEAPVLVVDDDGPRPRLVWEFRKAGASGSATRTTVDAQSGEQLSAADTAIRLYGYGRVYEGNPVATPSAIIASLPYLDRSGWLTGTHAKVYRFSNFVDPVLQGYQEAYDPRGLFYYLTEDSRMGQVQVYYGITRARDYYHGAFDFTGRDTQLPAFTQWNGLENALYMPDHPSSGAMAFGNGNGVDFSLDADVLYHEYFHAVSDVVNRAWTRAGEAAYEPSGISEGMADYFSCTMQEDPVLGEYAGEAFGRAFVRRLDSANRFPEDVQLPVAMPGGQTAQTFPQIHHIGKIWGAACWDLRTAIGKEATDRILFGAVGMLSPATRLQSGLVHVLAADAALHGGSHAATIRRVFAARGITETAYPVWPVPADAFAGDAGNGPRFGFVRIVPTHAFVEDYDYSPFGLYPSFVTGRRYAFPGYLRDASIRSVFLVLRDVRNQVVYRVGTDTAPLLSLSGSGAMRTIGRFELVLTPPDSIVRTGRGVSGSLRMFVHTYSLPAATVTTRFATLKPVSVSGGYQAQVLRSTATVGE